MAAPVYGMFQVQDSIKFLSDDGFEITGSKADEAAAKAASEDIADVTLVGDKERIERELSGKESQHLDKIRALEKQVEDYEEDKKRRLGEDSVVPKRIKYKKFARG